MAVKIDKGKCIKCGGCVSVCPAQALELKDDGIHVDAKKCTNCGNCVTFCPVGAPSLKKK